MTRAPLVAALGLVALCGCRDVSEFATGNDHYEGVVTASAFVRAGMASDVRICLSLDASHLDTTPGTLTSSDGRFRATPLRPIPQLAHDALSTISFGEGRVKNLVFAADDRGVDDLVFVSLLAGGSVEVRLVRGAPSFAADASAPVGSLFALFSLNRTPGACPL